MIEAFIAGERTPTGWPRSPKAARGTRSPSSPGLARPLHHPPREAVAAAPRPHRPLDATIAALDGRIDEVIAPFAQTRDRLTTIPGVGNAC